MNFSRHSLCFALAVLTVSAAHALPAPLPAGITQDMPPMPSTVKAADVPSRATYVPVVEKSAQQPVVAAVAKAEAPSGPTVATVPVKVLYVQENQPVQIVDSQGRLLQVIYLKKSK